jgi:hypothetical protein
MKRKTAFLICCIVIAGVFLASCNNDSEQNRAVVTVASMNGNAPFFSDVLDQGDTLFVGGVPYTPDDFLQEDFVEVIFQNQPYNTFVTTGPNLPLSDFMITRYRVEWQRVDGGSGVPPTYNGATAITVPSGELGIGYIVLVPYEVKASPLMSSINYLGLNFPDEYLSIATLTFWGHEIGSDREWSFGSQLSVNFADPVVVSED